MKCQLCERDVDSGDISKHHLVPKSNGGLTDETIDVCRQCQSQIHALYDNKTLAKQLNTLEKLKNDKNIEYYLKWVTNKKSVKFKTRRSW